MLNNSDINKSSQLNLGGIVGLLAAFYFVYYLLLKQNLLPFSISSVLAWTSQWSKHWHLLAVGLVPIYLGLMIFGTSVLSLYLGTAIQRWLTQRWH